jgi:hypothetical protein
MKVCACAIEKEAEKISIEDHLLGGEARAYRKLCVRSNLGNHFGETLIDSFTGVKY